MHRQYRVLVGVLFIVALLTAGSARGAPSAKIIYVDRMASGSDDGSSWTNAYTDLQDALGAAGPGDDIWVAQGIYYPAPNASDRTATFQLQDGVALYGGFAGTETGRDQRDWEANVTVLSGDLDRDDTTDYSEVVTDPANIQGDNAYHVLSSSGVTETAVLDGFTITAGHADGSEPQDLGGGMYNDHSSPTLTNVTFSGNQAWSGGGGMFNQDDSNPILTNCTFLDNTVLFGDGGGMYNDYSSPTLTDVTFSGNQAKYYGGGMYNDYSSPALTDVTFSGNDGRYGGGMYNEYDSPALTNVTFTGNKAEDGGGMYNQHDSNPTLTNATFSGNQADEGGGLFNWGSSPMLTNVTISGNRADGGGGIFNRDSSPILVNSILWGNWAPADPQIRSTGASTPSLIYSDIEGGYPGMHNIDEDPLFVDPAFPADAPTAAGDYRLTQGSPAVDAGTNAAVFVETDLDGNPRIVDGTQDERATVDMGAYEFQIPRLTVIKQGNGLVTSTPGPIDCGSVCTGEFLPATEVTLAATADTGWTFSGWSGDVVSTDNPLGLTIQDDTVITATFTEYRKVYLPLVLR